jgi:bifunctional DNA-binding transcriptional regulator/antitoxin component of YhaV-PrlF toxin-antitoxin module
MDKFFKTKIDKLVILRSVLMLIVVPVIIYFKGSGEQDITIVATIFELGILFPFGVLLPLRTAYKVTDDGLLIIPAGIRKIKINVKDIVSIKPRNSWYEFYFRTYVSSLDQLKLLYKKSSEITISPNDKEEFIKILQAQNPNIIT